MAIRWERASDRTDYKDLVLQASAPDPPPLLVAETKTVAGLDDLTWGSSTYNDEPITDFHVEISTEGVDISAVAFTGAGLDDATSGGTYTAGDAVHTYTSIIDHEGTEDAISAAVFTGTGLDDATSGGTYTLFATHTYTVIITTAGLTDKFKWKKDAGTLSAEISITGAAQTLSDGVTITFLATTGHTATDQWVITGSYDPDTFKWKKDAGSFTTGVAITTAAQTLTDGVTITFAARAGHTLTDQWVISTANPDKFDWLQDGGGGATDVAITAAAQTLADAVTITFAAKRHHTLADEWNISITPQIRLYGDDAGVLKYINSNGTVT